MVKPNGLLVTVSSTHHCAYTSVLSTWSSTTALLSFRLGNLISMKVSRLYAFSDGPSIQNHRITMSWFPTCLTRWSRSQPSLCHCTRRRISKPPELSFERLRYNLGGDRPSQTTRLPMSFSRITGGS